MHARLWYSLLKVTWNDPQWPHNQQQRSHKELQLSTTIHNNPQQSNNNPQGDTHPVSMEIQRGNNEPTTIHKQKLILRVIFGPLWLIVGSLWQVVGRRGSFYVLVTSIRTVQRFVMGCFGVQVVGSLCLVLDRCGIIGASLCLLVGCCWIVVDRRESLWIVVGRCGWLWIVKARCGTLWLVPCFSN